jgi:hypothetical protein
MLKITIWDKKKTQDKRSDLKQDAIQFWIATRDMILQTFDWRSKHLHDHENKSNNFERGRAAGGIDCNPLFWNPINLILNQTTGNAIASRAFDRAFGGQRVLKGE